MSVALSPDASLVGVYRRANAAHVAALLAPALRGGWATGWWALDSTAPELADVTVGEGRGEKLPLVNETLKRIGVATPWTLVSDDDVAFRRGDIVRLVRECERARLDLAQPARAPGTNLSHGITRAVRFSRVRRTTFVESGPLVVVGPRFRRRVLPLPEERGMGWGVEIDWFDLMRDGARLGIVDSVIVQHLGETAEHYDHVDMQRRLRAELEARGNPEWNGMRETLAVWRPWRRSPPW